MSRRDRYRKLPPLTGRGFVAYALRESSNRVSDAYLERDEAISNAYFDGATRAEIAAWTGLAKSRIDQILRGE